MNKNTGANDCPKSATNFFEIRVAKVDKLRRGFCSYPATYLERYKHVCDEEYNLWMTMSSLVRSYSAVGFPVAVGTRRGQYATTVYFETFRDARVTDICLAGADDIAPDLLFQIVAIFYSLHKYEAAASEYRFHVVAIPRTTVLVRVNDVDFCLSTSRLVVLSPETDLFAARLPQSCYLNFINRRADHLFRRHLRPAEYFVEWLIANHGDMLARPFVDLFKIKKKSAATRRIHALTRPGTLVSVPRDDVLLFGVTVSEVSLNDVVRVMYSQDGQLFEIDDFDAAEVFAAPEHFLRTGPFYLEL
ncbi:ORF121 [Saltwater crocodilepox virus]|nr:hypothetical protein [Saltwater crocodilepox virus]AVD69456.1 hypothetical protein [Saltwater crocodilepox virus]QGT46559.1 ORF121 [Saltwater crocodilepox virus]QGT46775.1 ORF121 [Saltwater crocodilepox virus]QGT46991.1 ORF121 [Saltwater crocodilepox virus]